MLVLAVDTSLSVFSVALTRDGEMVAAAAADAAGSRNEKLLPAVDWVFQAAEVDKRALDLLVVSRGPGSFTGVRIGLATMQGLSKALGIKLCALSTHEAGAGWNPGGSFVVTSDAGRGELYFSAWENGEVVRAPSLVSADEAQREGLRLGQTIALEALMRSQNLALLLAGRAAALAQEGKLHQYGDATPLYVRLAEAEARRLANRGG